MEAVMNEMRIMDPSLGHATIKWDPSSENDVEVAREAFDAARKRGHSIFVVGRFGKKGRRLDSFDPDAKQMMVVPHLSGG